MPTQQTWGNAKLRIAVFWYVTPCSLVEVHWCIKRLYCPQCYDTVQFICTDNGSSRFLWNVSTFLHEANCTWKLAPQSLPWECQIWQRKASFHSTTICKGSIPLPMYMKWQNTWETGLQPKLIMLTVTDNSDYWCQKLFVYFSLLHKTHLKCTWVILYRQYVNSLKEVHLISIHAYIFFHYCYYYH